MNAPMSPEELADILLEAWNGRATRKDALLLEDSVRDNLDQVVKFALGRAVDLTKLRSTSADIAQELKYAAAYVMEQTLFREGAGHYQILGIRSSASATVIRDNYRLIMQVVHPDRRRATAALPESIAPRVNQAYAVLRNADLRAAYDSEQPGSSRVDGPQSGTARAFVRPQPRPMAVRSRPVHPPLLPEWLTAKLFGFVRNNPALTMFVTFGMIAVGFIAAVSISEHDARLLRDETSGFTPSRPQSAAAPAPIVFTDEAEVVSVTAQRQEREVVATLPKPAAAATPHLLPDDADRRVDFKALPVAAAIRSSPVRLVETTPATPLSAQAASRDPAPRPLRESASAATETGLQNAIVEPVQSAALSPAITSSPPTTVVSTAPRSSGIAHGETPPDPPKDPRSSATDTADVEATIAAFISHYESGRLDSFIALFDPNATTTQLKGRSAIRAEYDEFFRKSSSRTMTVSHMVWRRSGDTTEARGDVAVHIAWNDGRQLQQRVALELEMIRRDGKIVITRLLHKVM